MNTNSHRVMKESRKGNRLWMILLPFLAVYVAGFTVNEKSEPELEKVYSQINEAGKNFRSFTAKYTKKQYTAVLQEFGTPETGEFCYARARDGSVLLRMEGKNPSKNILTIKGEMAVYYQPNIKQAQIYNLGKNKDKAEYLAFGIGQPLSRLQKDYEISYQGDGTVNGKPCYVLEYKPKDPKEASYFTSITVWFGKSSGIPVQNKMQYPNGDYQLMTFFDEKLNVTIPNSKFEQKLPDDVDKQRRNL